MALSEFDLIRTYFERTGLMADPALHPGVVLGIGDDCALLSVAEEYHLAVSLDVLVSGVHFPVDADPAMIAWRALVVNLSDLAAMGAKPLGFTLGLTLPQVDTRWLEQFSSGLNQVAQHYHCPLLGGDTTRGPLQIAIQVHGTVPKGKALRRNAARVGDDVYVSGSLGRAGLALSVLDGTLHGISDDVSRELLTAYYEPVPRLALGHELLGIARAAQDVSDGLLADAGHVARRSRVKIRLEAERIPVAALVKTLCPPERAMQLALTAGDEYELVFTAARDQRDEVLEAATQSATPVTRIGSVLEGEGIMIVTADGVPLSFDSTGYRHF